MLTEKDLLTPLFQTLNLPTCRNVALTIVTFLSKDEIDTLCEGFGQYTQEHFFVLLCRNMRFIGNYLNSTDKSLYFTFYEEEEYKQIEIAMIAAISQKNSNVFGRSEQSIAALMDCMKEKIPAMEQELESLLELLKNPDLPLPKLKRQTQGIFCTSPFQLFLVNSTFSDQESADCFTCFQQFKSFLSAEREEEYLKQFMGILRQKNLMGSELKKIMKVRYTPYEINGDNFREYLIEGNQLHNFIVCLFALTDIMLEVTHNYVRMIGDPLHRLVELTLRYNIYRNYVLAIEDYLSFAFSMYQNIYHEAIQQSHDRPKYKFWRPALTKWFLKMNHLHTEGQEVYMHCLIKLRNNKLKVELTERYGHDQATFGKFVDRIQSSDFEYKLCEKISGMGESELSIFFDQHPQNYEIVVMEFNDYLVDISVNEQTVHWCGSSTHQLEQPYVQYEQAVVDVSLGFLKSLVGLGKVLSKQDIHEIVEIDIDYISSLQIKNRTLKKMLTSIDTQYILDHPFSVFSNFDQADHKLQYFNHKALILAVLDQTARPFYSIPPHYSPEKLIDLIDTNDSASNYSESEQIQYFSESDNKNKGEKLANKKEFEQEDSDEETNLSHMKVQYKGSGSKRKPKSTKTFLLDEEEEAMLEIGSFEKRQSA